MPGDMDQKEIRRLIEEVAAEGCRSLTAWPGMVLHDDPDLEWTSSDVPFAMFNNIFRLHSPPDKAAAAVERAVEQASERGVPLMWWAMEPEDDLYSLLRVYGFEDAGEIRGMAADTADIEVDFAPPGGIDIREVETIDELRAWNEVMTAQFRFPVFAARAHLEMYAHIGVGKDRPWRHFIAESENGVEGVSSLFSGTGAAMIAGVGVRSGFRNKGLGTAMTRRAAEEAGHAGYEIVVLLAGPESERLYARMGFNAYSSGHMYVWEGFADRQTSGAANGEYATAASLAGYPGVEEPPTDMSGQSDQEASSEPIKGGIMTDEQHRNETQHSDPDSEQRLDLSFTRSTREIAAAALVGAIIAVVTLVVVFFSFRDDITNYDDRIQKLDSKVTERVNSLQSDMDQRVTALEERLDNISKLPEQIRRQVLLDTVREMGARAEFLKGQVDDKQVNDKLEQLDALLKEIETGIEP